VRTQKIVPTVETTHPRLPEQTARKAQPVDEALTRKEFLVQLARLTATLGLTPLVGEMLAAEARGATRGRQNTSTQREVLYYTKLPQKRIQCFVCPLNCILNDGETCFCRTRTNYGGTLYSEAYNNPCILQVDPVEKGPFYHVVPGTQTLALGTAGCNLRCIFCQNWQLSQKRPSESHNLYLDSEQAVSSAALQDCRSITYTYTEPVVFYEYMVTVARAARAKGLKNFVATAAFINSVPLKDLCKCVDGFVVSLKAFTEEGYKTLCGQAMRPVLDALRTIREEGTWLELVYVIIPTLNDDVGQIKQLGAWIVKELGASTPLHLARFFPAYKVRNLSRTPLKLMEDARAATQDAGLRFVYLDNVPGHLANSTRCPSCNTLLIERVGFQLLKNSLNSNSCPRCGFTIPGIF
jgi:pyruvate formate lyase activating enzyme